MKSRFLPLGVALLILIAASAGVWLAREVDSSAPRLTSGTWLPQARPIGDFSLIDQNGAAFNAARLAGSPSLVFFGYTHCPDVCPLTLLQLAKLKQAGAVPALKVVFISVDPGRDTPALLAQYVHAFDPDMIAATGRTDAVAGITHAFGVAYERVDLPGGDYAMDHSATVFLLDAHARNVAVFSPPFDVATLTADLKLVAGRLG